MRWKGQALVSGKKAQVTAAMRSFENNFVFQTAGPAYIPEISGLIAESFASGEPLCRALGALFQEMTEQAVSMGLCLCALDLSHGRIAGVLIFQDFGLPYVADPRTLCPEAAPVFSLIEQLFLPCQPNTRTDVELHLAATRSGYASDRIASRLVLASRSMLRAKGYRRIYSALTNPASQRAFLRFARLENTLDPSEFSYEGRKVFAHSRVPGSVVLASRRIDDPVSAFLTLRPVRACLGQRNMVSEGLRTIFARQSFARRSSSVRGKKGAFDVL